MYIHHCLLSQCPLFGHQIVFSISSLQILLQLINLFTHIFIFWNPNFRVNFQRTGIVRSKFSSVAQSCLTLQPHEPQTARPPCPSSTPGVYPRRQWHPTPVLWPGKSCGRGSLVHGVATSATRLSNFTFTFHFHALEEEMATHSSILAWRIPGTGEPGGLPSMGSHRVGHN